ncbi:MAG: hypothetical protein V3V49_01620, partial [Candidatus Krumholzibacteria bacterium]
MLCIRKIGSRAAVVALHALWVVLWASPAMGWQKDVEQPPPPTALGEEVPPLYRYGPFHSGNRGDFPPFGEYPYEREARGGREEGWNVDLVGRWVNGQCLAVAVRGDTIFYGNGVGLEMVEFSGSPELTELGSVILSNTVRDIALSGDYAYVAAGPSGLRVIDFANYPSPREVGFFDPGGVVRGIAIDGDRAYLAADTKGLRIVDISDPTAPVELGFYDTPGQAWGVAVSGNYAYLADGGFGFSVFDVSDPGNAVEVFNRREWFVCDVAIHGNYAYVSYQHYVTDHLHNALAVYDISNPESLLSVGHLHKGFCTGIAFSGDYAYMSEAKRLLILDISDRTRPLVVGEIGIEGYGIDVAAWGNYAFVAGGSGGLRIIDTSNPASPVAVTNTARGDVAWKVRMPPGSGGYTYVAAREAGMWVIDISDRARPKGVANSRKLHVSFSRGAKDIAFSEHHAYVATGASDLMRVIDISNPKDPVQVGAWDRTGRGEGIDVLGGYAYVAAGNRGLWVLDISDPANPLEMGSLVVRSWDVSVSGKYAYVVGFFAIRVIDISDPTNPTEVHSVDGSGFGVALSGGYAYVAAWRDGLRIFDIATVPGRAIEVGSYDPGGTAWGIAVAGDYAYLAAGEAGVRVIDVSNPASPAEVGYYVTGGQARGVSVSGNYIYVAAETHGLYVLRS